MKAALVGSLKSLLSWCRCLSRGVRACLWPVPPSEEGAAFEVLGPGLGDAEAMVCEAKVVVVVEETLPRRIRC